MATPARAVERRRGHARGIGIGRIFGIELRLDPSVLVIFALVVASLGLGTLEAWHPDWSTALVWAVAVAAGLLLFLSILLHELAHSVVAKSFGIPVPRITLFLFGGLSEMESEPETPGQELAIAIVGPLTSLALGIGCMLAASAVMPAAFQDAVLADPATAMSALDVPTTLLLWLGPVNLVLGVFNLVPGFPLDGGRVLRAAIWKLTGDHLQATTWASRAGQLVAFALMAVGVVMVFGGRLDGLWLLFIGWFLNNAARTSHGRMLLEHFLEDLHVGDLMRTQIEAVSRDMPLTTFVDEVLRRSDQGVWPVLDENGELVGSISVSDVQELPRDAHLRGTVGDIAAPVEDVLSPADTGVGALRSLAASGHHPLLVVDHGETVGLLRPRDIARWLMVAELRGA